MTFKLDITFVDESKDSYVEKSGRVATEEQNGSGLWKFAGESGSDSLEIAN